MGELRRDDGPADRIPTGDRPAKNAETPDLTEPHSVDRHKTTPAQRDFHRETSDAPLETDDVPYSINWKTGERTDHRRHADPPEDFTRANSDLEARTIQRAEDVTRFDRFSDVEPGRRKSRGAFDKFVEKSEDLTEKVGDVSDALDGIVDSLDLPATLSDTSPTIPCILLTIMRCTASATSPRQSRRSHSWAST